MATRSNICIKRKDGSIESIYCHWDGYLEYNGRILLEHYNGIEKINNLLNLGDISSLGNNLDSTDAYGRDNGEIGTEKAVYKNLEDYLNNVDYLDIEYIYMFDELKNEWLYSTGRNFHKLTRNIVGL